LLSTTSVRLSVTHVGIRFFRNAIPIAVSPF
jgi:hypothetical protein